MKLFNKEVTKKQLFNETKKIIVIIIANFILALGTGLFISPLNIVAGGVTGIAIIINQFLPANSVFLDIIIYGLEAILIIFSFIFLGKKATFKSILSCLIYPLFITLVVRVPFFVDLGQFLAKDAGTAEILLGGLVGGILSGSAIAITFGVGGTTGGTDIIILIIKKYLPKFKESAISFVIDFLIIVLGTFILWQFQKIYYVTALVNVICALSCALVIEAVYIMRNSSISVEIISSKWEEINNFIQNKMERGATIYDVFGGYKLEGRRLIKVVINKKEYELVRKMILEIDDQAFVTFTITKTVLGNGFSHNNPFE